MEKTKGKGKSKKEDGRGRPRVNINYDIVDKKLRARCSGASIATSMGIHPNTLYNAVVRDKKMSFDDYARERGEEGSDLLKLKQFDIAMKGDKTMLIWLGKQYLGQSEKVEQNNTHRLDKITVNEVVVLMGDDE